MNQWICLTGKGPKTRNKLIEDIHRRGDFYDPQVTWKTNILLINPTSTVLRGVSHKLDTALKLGTKIMRYDEYFSS